MAESRVNVKPALAPWAFAVLCAYAISLGLAAAGSSVRYSASGVPYWSLQDPGMSVAVATFVSIVLLAPLTLLTCIVTLCVLVVHSETLSRIRRPKVLVPLLALLLCLTYCGAIYYCMHSPEQIMP
jgi:hypothetical protein